MRSRLGTPRKKLIYHAADAGEHARRAHAPQHEKEAQHDGDKARHKRDFNGAQEALTKEDPRGRPREELPVARGELPRHVEAPDDKANAHSHKHQRDGRPEADAPAGVRTGRLVQRIAHGGGVGCAHRTILTFLSMALPMTPITNAVPAYMRAEITKGRMPPTVRVLM